MQIKVRAGQPDITLNKTELDQLGKAMQIVEALAVYAQDSLAEDVREPLAGLIGKYSKGEAG